MRDFFLLLLTFWITTLFLPWWALLIFAFILGAALFDKSFLALITGFTAAFSAWGLQVIYIDIANQSILSTRMAELLGVGQSWIVILLTAMIGGIIGGMGTLLGTRFRLLFKPAQQTRSAS